MGNQRCVFPSSCDEDASRPLIRDRTIIKEKRRFAKQRLIATVDRDESLHQTVTPKTNSLNAVLRDGRTRPWNFEKFELFRHPFHAPFDSLCS